MLRPKITSSKKFNKKAPAEETSPKTSQQKRRHKNTKALSFTWGFFKKDKTRQQSTLAQQRGRTTIDGRRLNERVRNGNVCFPPAYDHQAKYLTRNNTSRSALRE